MSSDPPSLPSGGTSSSSSVPPAFPLASTSALAQPPPPPPQSHHLLPTKHSHLSPHLDPAHSPTPTTPGSARTNDAVELVSLANAMMAHASGATDEPSPANPHHGAEGPAGADGHGHGQGGGGGGGAGEGGSATGHMSFVGRLYRHLSVTFALRSFPRGQSGGEDGHDWDQFDATTFLLPLEGEARQYVQCYFEHASVTYRYLDRQVIDAALTRFYARDDATARDTHTVCLLLLVLAIGCLWTPSWTSADPADKTKQALGLYIAARRKLAKAPQFPIRLSSVQIRLLLVQLQLGLSRFQTAWMTFGEAGRMAQLIGLHRASGEGVADDEARRRTLWSAYMLDRYLSLVLGFPALFDDRDITQPYFSTPLPEQTGPNVDRLLVGALAHVKLSQILGRAIRLLGRKDLPSTERDQIVNQLESELALWTADTPPFFHPANRLQAPPSPYGTFAQVPSYFERQQRVVHAAYHFLRLFIYRTYLLSSFLDRLPGAAAPEPERAAGGGGGGGAGGVPAEVRVCVEAAVQIASLGAEIAESADQGRSTFGSTYWSSAYQMYAALTVLCVYQMMFPLAPDRAAIERLISKAMKGHQILAGSTAEERQDILSETRRLGELFRPAVASAASDESEGDRSGQGQNQGEGEVALGLALPGMEGGGGLEGEMSGFEVSEPMTDWDAIWTNMQGLAQSALDPLNSTYGTGYNPFGLGGFGAFDGGLYGGEIADIPM